MKSSVIYIRNRTAFIVISAIFLSCALLVIMTPNERYVAGPVMACTILMLWLWMFLWKRDGQIPFFDVGVFCALATFIYTVFPLLNFWINGLQFGFLSDTRLIYHNLSPVEMGTFHFRHVMYLFSFIAIYAYFRGKETIQVCKIDRISRSDQKIIILYFILLTCFFILLKLETGHSYNFSYSPESFESYLETVADIPLFLFQISNKLWGIRFVFKLALLFIVTSKCAQKKWRFILFAWIILEITYTFLIQGARTELILFLIATALLYHRLVKTLTFKFLFISGMLVLTGFLFLGIYRTNVSLADLLANLFNKDIGIFSAGNEFQSLLGTTYDVYILKKSGIDLPWYLYINDIITILPPRQLLPFEKISASEWYLRQIGLSGTGIGLMWGVITQSIIGFDWLEIVLRGAILGYLLARLHRWYLNNQTGFFETLVYTYACLRVYYTFRDTTFSPLSNFVWEIIPFYILLRMRIILIKRKDKNNAAGRHQHFVS